MLTCIKWISVVIILPVTLIFTYCSYDKGEGLANVGSLLILGLTLVVLIFYAASTYEIANVNRKTYEDNKLPVVSLNVNTAPDPANNYNTSIKLENFSAYNVQAFVKLNLKVNGQPVELSGAHSGEEPWPLTAHQAINSHFYIADVLARARTSMVSMKAQFSSENVRSQLSMDIEVYYRGVTRGVCPRNTWPHDTRNPRYNNDHTRILVNPVQKWYYHFSRDIWIYDL